MVEARQESMNPCGATAKTACKDSGQKVYAFHMHALPIFLTLPLVMLSVYYYGTTLSLALVIPVMLLFHA